MERSIHVNFGFYSENIKDVIKYYKDNVFLVNYTRTSFSPDREIKAILKVYKDIKEFESESKIIKDLSYLSDTFVKVYEIIVEKQALIIEYCEGESLYNRKLIYDKNFKVRETQLLYHFTYLLKAIKIAHKYDYAHRDISPHNIFIKNGYLKIGDFGSSKQLMDEGFSTTTIVGNFPYFSPILSKHFKSDHQRSISNPLLDDVWSLGVIFFELSIGRFLSYKFHDQNRDLKTQEEIDSIIDKSLKKYSISFRKIIKIMLTYEEELRASSKKAYKKARKAYNKAIRNNK